MLTVEQLSGMSMPELLTEEKSRYQQMAEFDKKYPTGLTPQDSAEDFAQYKSLADETDQLSGYIGAKQTAQQRQQHNQTRLEILSRPGQQHEQPNGEPDSPKALEMFGQQFVNDEHYKRIVASGEVHSAVKHRFDVALKGSLLAYLAHKALVYSASGQGGNLIVNDRQPGFQEILQRELTLLDLIPTAQTTSNLIEYAKEKTFTNNAATVAEATATTGTTGLKAESVLNFELATSPVQTIAHWIPVTNQMLADAPQVRGIIDNRLMYGLNQELEDQILSGNGTPPNLGGILASGLSTVGLSAGSTYGGQATAVDAAFAAMLIVQVTGLARPNGVVLNPLDWAAIRLARESAVTGNVNPGGYLYGPPSVAGPQTLWGRPVVLSLGMTENTILVGDFQLGCMMFDREQGAIRVGTIDDQFVRNMQTILAEMRAAFVVFRPTAFARVTGA
jgi:HK97 family phage major capsid protein